MEKEYILSPARRLAEEEQKLVWKKPITHIKSQAEQRICEEVKRNWLRGEMKISNILLGGDASSGKTRLAKALSAEFGLPYTKVTCFYQYCPMKMKILKVLNTSTIRQKLLGHMRMDGCLKCKNLQSSVTQQC